MITPDTKDWTWVLETPCAECGFDSAAIRFPEIPARTRAVAIELAAAVRAPGSTTRLRPTVWSALEYGAHVRDAFRIFADRVTLMRNESGPHFPNWDQDETAIAERYGEQDPRVVAAELLAAADVAALTFAAVPAAEWGRTGFRGDGSAFTIESLGKYFIHDPIHHLWDVRGGGR